MFFIVFIFISFFRFSPGGFFVEDEIFTQERGIPPASHILWGTGVVLLILSEGGAHGPVSEEG